MSLYKLGISDKTTKAMQNSDPEVQKMMLESQQNNNQPDSGGGIRNIIKELFGFGDAEASDFGALMDNNMLQSILNPKTPKLGENLYDPPGRRILASRIRPEVDTSLSYAGLSPINLMPNPNYPEYAELNKGATGTIPTLNNTGIMSVVEDNDLEASAIPEFAEGELKQPFGLQTLLSFLPFGDNSILGKIGQGIRNTIQGSRFYRPATTGIFGYSPAELNRMNALGGFYSEPAREGRRRANRISRMLQRAAAGKKFSQKNLSNLMNQFNMGDVDTRGMIDSIRQSADMGYGKGGGRDFDSGRDYSSSPGAIAGDMEYGEE